MTTPDLMRHGKAYRLSKFVTKISCPEGAQAFFHSLNMEVLFVLEAEGNQSPTTVLSRHARLLEECIARHFLVPVDHDERKHIRQLIEKCKLGEMNFAVFKMVLSTKCNLACRYCLIQENLKDRSLEESNLSTSRARKMLEFFWQACQLSNQAHRTLMLYGGEPLCNWRVLKYVVGLARRAEADGATSGPLEIVLETNATLVNPEIARFLADNRVFSIVSLDGLPEIHNANRRTRTGGPSWQRSLKGYQTLLRHGAHAVVSCVFSKQFADKCEEAIRYLARDVRPASIGLNLYHVLEQRALPDNRISELIPRYVDSWKIARQEGLYIEHIMRRIRPLVTQQIRLADCQACGHRIVSDVDGTIGICEGFLGDGKYFSYRSSAQELLDDEVFRQWARRSPLTMENCEGCLAQGVCGGGCVYNAIVLKGSAQRGDPYICEAARQLVAWAIRKWSELPSVRARLRRSSTSWLRGRERGYILGKVPLSPKIPLQSMSMASETVPKEH